MGALLGLGLKDIAQEVEKNDAANPSVQAVAHTIKHAEQNGGCAWDGNLPSGAGRPRHTSNKLDKAILALVYKKRGSLKVTAGYVRKVLKEARRVSERTTT